jgi:uncharacterized caspase-like protein
MNELAEFLKEVDVDDTVVLFFSGHGMSRKKTITLMGRQYDDYDYYFVTPTATLASMGKEAISIREIRALLGNVKSRQKLLFTDTCQSNLDNQNPENFVDKSDGDGNNRKGIRTVIALKNGGSVNFENGKSNRGFSSFVENNEVMDETRRFYPELRRGSGTIEISAASYGTAAHEAITLPDGKKMENGVMTYAILKALNGEAAKKTDTGYYISAQSLRTYVLDKIQELTTDAQTGKPLQVPMVTREIAGRDFIIEMNEKGE